MMLASPLARGLFSAALMESGACVAHTRDAVEAFGADLVEAAGCGGDADPIACMRALPADAMTLAIPAVIDVAGKQTDYQPHVDGHVLAAAPLDAIAAGEHNAVPFVIGANSDETGAVVPAMTEAEYTQAVYVLAGSQTLGDAILAQYPVADYSSPRAAYVALTSDVKFICTARTAARAAAGGQSEPVYRYHFTHAIENGGPQAAALGAFHGLELVFVFDHVEQIANYTPSAGEVALADSMGGYWTRFAGAGDPNGGGAVAWPLYEAATDSYLRLDNTIEAGQGVRTEQCDFWDSLLAN
jgi:para-nitrobenzyl esterase